MVMPYGNWSNNAGYPAGAHGCGCGGYYGGWGVNSFALIVVLFILLIIVGTAYVY